MPKEPPQSQSQEQAQSEIRSEAASSQPAQSQAQPDTLMPDKEVEVPKFELIANSRRPIE